MSRFYVACDLGQEQGRVMMGALHRDQLIISEGHCFPNRAVQGKDGLQWDVPHLYQQLLEGLRGAGAYDEPVDGVSCSSWAGDYLLFDKNGALLPPAFRGDARTGGMEKMLADVSWEEVYEETGIAKIPDTTLFQLGAEHPRRLKKATYLLPVADGFNYLLTGVPRVEVTSASPTQLFDPEGNAWSGYLMKKLKIRSDLFPSIVPSGTLLGPLREEIAKDTRLAEAKVVASCSHSLAAALAGLTAAEGERSAYLRQGTFAIMGAQLEAPLVNDLSRDLDFTNELGYMGSVCFHKRLPGLWVYEACQRIWEKENRQFDLDLLTHIASAATPFESLINLTDPRFEQPEDMPLKIQAFCKETNQEVPRKPGQIFRCILESMALFYRKTLQQIEYLTGSHIERLYLLGDGANDLLNHFIANALQVPVVIVSPNAAAVGNIVVQALALGHLQSIEQGREMVRKALNAQTITPHPAAWGDAYDRFEALTAEPPAASAAEAPA